MKLLRVFAPVWIALGFFGAELSMAEGGAESSITLMGTEYNLLSPNEVSFPSTVQVQDEWSDILRFQPELQVERWTVPFMTIEGTITPIVPFDADRLASDEGFLPSELQKLVFDGVLDDKFFTDLQHKNPTTLDIQTLGYPYPNEPVDLIAVYRNEEFDGVFTNKQIRQMAWAQEKTHQIIPVVTVWAGTVVSSLDTVLTVALQQLCSSAYRPSQFSIALKAGVQFFASFEGQLTFTFDVEDTCDRL